MYADYGTKSGKTTPRVSIRRNFTRIMIKIKQKHYLHSHGLTKEKTILAFKGFHNKKSPGTDNLNPLVLKYLPAHAVDQIVKLYKATVILEFTPTKWKDCKIIFIPDYKK